jgi:chromosome segregation ATPase
MRLIRQISPWAGAAAAALLAAGFVPSSASEPAASPVAPLEEQVAEVNRTLKELVVLLREQMQAQRADTLMRRLDLKVRALAPLETELAGARSECRTLQDQIVQIQTRQEQVESELDEIGRSPAPGRPEEQLKVQKAENEMILKLLGEKLAAAEQHVLEVENDLAGRRSEIKALEEQVDAQLGLR